MVFLQAIEGVLSILLMVAVGYVLTAKGWFNKENSKILPKLVNYVSLPTYMIWNFTTTFDKSMLENMLYGLVVPVISLGICLIIGFATSRLLKIAPNRKGIFQSTFFSSSAIFVGVPVNLALFGESSIPYVLLYFLGNTIYFWTVGNYVISTDGQTNTAKIFSLDTIKNLMSPPLMGFIAATALVLLGVHLPSFILSTFKYLGSMTTPLSLLFIGIVMFGVNLRKIKLTKDLTAVMVGRFIICPLSILLVAAFIPIPEIMKKVFVIQSALPAMTQTTILASLYKADTEYAATLVSLTNIVAMIAIPLYMVIL